MSHRLRDKRRFRLKIANFSHLCVFNASAEGSLPLEMEFFNGSGALKTTMMSIPYGGEILTICALVYTTPQPDGRTKKRKQ